MWSIIDERKKGDFKSFQDIRERIPSLHDPAKVLAHRIEGELKDDFIKYRLFTAPRAARSPSEQGTLPVLFFILFWLLSFYRSGI